jgi:hypothetical protein
LFEVLPTALALCFECATLELEDAVLDPVVDAWGESSAEARHEDEEAEDEGVAEGDNC